MIEQSNLSVLRTDFIDYKTNPMLYNQQSDYVGYLGEWGELGPYSYPNEDSVEFERFINGKVLYPAAFEQLRSGEWELDCSNTLDSPSVLVPHPKLIKHGKLLWDQMGNWVDFNNIVRIADTWWLNKDVLTGLFCSQSFLNDYLDNTREILVIFNHQEKMIVRSEPGEFKRIVIETMTKFDGKKFRQIKRKQTVY